MRTFEKILIIGWVALIAASLLLFVSATVRAVLAPATLLGVSLALIVGSGVYALIVIFRMLKRLLKRP